MRQSRFTEARRIMGDLKLHAAIEFSGYRRLWVWIMAMLNADQKIIFQHNDLYSEMAEAHPDLMGVFRTYQHYDKIVSVSEETRALNLANLSEFYTAAQSFAVPNTLNLPAIAQSAAGEPQTITTDGQTYTVIESPSSGNDALYFKTMPQLDPSKINFMTIGRASGEKNQTMLLHAFKQLHKTQHICISSGMVPYWKRSANSAMRLDLRIMLRCLGLRPMRCTAASLRLLCAALSLRGATDGDPRGVDPWQTRDCHRYRRLTQRA